VCLEALVKIGGDAYITLIGDRKAFEKIDILHDCPPSPRLRGSPFALDTPSIQTDYRERKVACHPKLWRIPGAKGGGADGSRTHDLLNAIQALSQLSYGPTGMQRVR
jgi:hypothetical protein